jgi:hypothetical protein
MADDFGIDPDIQRRLLQQQSAQVPQIPPGGYPREDGTGLQMRGAALAKPPGTMLTPPADPTAPGKVAPPPATPVAPAAPAAPGLTIPPPGPMGSRMNASMAAGAPQLHGWRKVLDTIGQIAAPHVEEKIPGSVGNYWNQLGKEAGAAKEEQAGRAAQDTAAKVPGEIAEAGARTENLQAETKRTNALPTVTNELELFAQQNPGAPLADYVRALTAARIPTNEFELALKQNPNMTAQEYLQLQQGAKPPKELIQSQLNAELSKPAPDKKVVADLQNRLRQIDPMAEDRLRDAESRAANAGPKQLVMVPQPDGTTQVVEAKPGTVLPRGATTLAEAGKEQTAMDAKNAAQQYADDYLANKQFTGAGDEALMEKYFELAKPSSGFRMTQAQIEMLQHARDLMGGLEARAKHAITPEAPYFSDTQRQQIVQTMRNIGTAGNEARSGGGTAGGGPPSPQPGMKVQSRTVNGKTEYRQVPVGAK